MLLHIETHDRFVKPVIVDTLYDHIVIRIIVTSLELNIDYTKSNCSNNKGIKISDLSGSTVGSHPVHFLNTFVTHSTPVDPLHRPVVVGSFTPAPLDDSPPDPSVLTHDSRTLLQENRSIKPFWVTNPRRSESCQRTQPVLSIPKPTLVLNSFPGTTFQYRK